MLGVKEFCSVEHSRMQWYFKVEKSREVLDANDVYISFQICWSQPEELKRHSFIHSFFSFFSSINHMDIRKKEKE